MDMLLGVGLPAFFGLAVLGLVGAAIIFGPGIRERQRRRRARMSVEQIWRELVATRILYLPSLFLLAGFIGPPLLAEKGVLIASLFIGIILAGAVALTWRCARDVRRGWMGAQGTPLAEQARAIAAEAQAQPDTEAPGPA